MFETVFEVPHAGKHQQREDGGENSYRVHAETDRDTHTCRYPKARRGRRAVHRVRAEYDNAAPEKSDAHDDSRSAAHGVKTGDAYIRGIHEISGHDKETRAEGYKAEGARARGLFGEDRALGADDATENHRQKQLGEHDDGRVYEKRRSEHASSIQAPGTCKQRNAQVPVHRSLLPF